jgi:hypothetical protein
MALQTAMPLGRVEVQETGLLAGILGACSPWINFQPRGAAVGLLLKKRDSLPNGFANCNAIGLSGGPGGGSPGGDLKWRVALGRLCLQDAACLRLFLRLPQDAVLHPARSH